MDNRTGMLCVALSSLVTLLVSCTNAAQLKESLDSEAPTYADKFNEFDWHISKAIGGSIKNNVILSPISVKLVLAMLYEGASGTTAKELEDVLKIEKGPAPAQRFSNVLQSLQGSDSGYELHVGMKLFIDKEAKPKKSYAAKIANLYNATIDPINFKNTAEAVAQVNSWAHSVTRGHIQHLLTEADAHHSTLMLLLNAVYFKGLWKYPFLSNNTKEGAFITEENVPVKVEYMNGVQTLSYYDSLELKSTFVRLPYVGDKFAMYIILPDKGITLNEVIGNLTPTKVRSCLDEMMQVPVNISLPKFNFEFASSLAPALKQVGINEIFSNKADLRNIAEGPRDPVVSNVIQKAAIEVNELGTVAAVVSAIELVNKFGMHTLTFNVSRPFIFFIEDETTNTVIFIGKVVNPVAPGKPIVSASVPVTTTASPPTTETTQYSSSLKPETTTTSATPNIEPVLLSGSLGQRGGGNVVHSPPFYNFDFQLLQELSHTERNNWVISPASIKTTLGLILEGTSSSTAIEIARVLRLCCNVTVARAELRKVQKRMQNTPDVITVKSGSVMLAKQGLAINNKFRENARFYYSANITSSDFTNNALVSKEINKWINGLTNGNIPEIITPDSINPGTILMLANAMYFKGDWKVKLKLNPGKQCFYNPDCTVVKMMTTTASFKYGEIASLKARILEMPYEDPRYSMIILLPKEEQSLQDLTQFNSIISFLESLVPIEVKVVMPKFNIEYSLEMKPLLEKYSLEKIFSDSADFSELFGSGTRAKISSFLHKAKIEVTEKGTVASAATVAQFQLLSTGSVPHFVANHPFFFFIRDSQAGFLFQGQVTNPVGSLSQEAALKKKDVSNNNLRETITVPSLNKIKTERSGVHSHTNPLFERNNFGYSRRVD
ncbi:unnamed protein product [Nezara viridula]|uniref:Serpin domain-containing protein n=1 Tax=Nezara viridula TaxID=85310 RepID=A0A9P0HJE0_NEZVI|nr:unnamed protein product [Nezara viridula]